MGSKKSPIMVGQEKRSLQSDRNDNQQKFLMVDISMTDKEKRSHVMQYHCWEKRQRQFALADQESRINKTVQIQENLSSAEQESFASPKQPYTESYSSTANLTNRGTSISTFHQEYLVSGPTGITQKRQTASTPESSKGIFIKGQLYTLLEPFKCYPLVRPARPKQGEYSISAAKALWALLDNGEVVVGSLEAQDYYYDGTKFANVPEIISCLLQQLIRLRAMQCPMMVPLFRKQSKPSQLDQHNAQKEHIYLVVSILSTTPEVADHDPSIPLATLAAKYFFWGMSTINWDIAAINPTIDNQHNRAQRFLVGVLKSSKSKTARSISNIIDNYCATSDGVGKLTEELVFSHPIYARTQVKLYTSETPSAPYLTPNPTIVDPITSTSICSRPNLQTLGSSVTTQQNGGISFTAAYSLNLDLDHTLSTPSEPMYHVSTPQAGQCSASPILPESCITPKLLGLLAPKSPMYSRIPTPQSPNTKGDQPKTLCEDKRSKISEKEEYRCSMCPTIFFSKSNVRRHARRIHGKKTHECSQCPQKFASKSGARAHERHSHGKKIYGCVATTSEHNQVMGHSRAEIFEQYYISQKAKRDVQSAYIGCPARESVD
ncbi:hypothetical protein FQN57_002594 [Myotisia sp. PD_48]|nr:hypothetical protein FQN57_002594 [Myotisia sp. PD_48]